MSSLHDIGVEMAHERLSKMEDPRDYYMGIALEEFAAEELRKILHEVVSNASGHLRKIGHVLRDVETT